MLSPTPHYSLFYYITRANLSILWFFLSSRSTRAAVTVPGLGESEITAS